MSHDVPQGGVDPLESARGGSALGEVTRREAAPGGAPGGDPEGARCPSCERGRAPLGPKVVSWVCAHCGALIDARAGEVVSRQTPTEEVWSPFLLGRLYHLSSPSASSELVLTGELKLQNGQGQSWVELFFVRPRTGEERWLVIDEGEIYLFKRLPPAQVREGGLPLHSSALAAAERVGWGGVSFKRDEAGVAEVVSARGELFTEVRIGERFDYWQGYDPEDEDCLSGELFGGGEVAWSYGEWREGSDLLRWNKGRERRASFTRARGRAAQREPDALDELLQLPLMGLRLKLAAVILLTVVVFSVMRGDELRHLFELPAQERLSASGALSFDSPPFEVGAGEVMVEALLPEELGVTSLSLELVNLTTGERASLLGGGGRLTLSANTEGLRSTIGIPEGRYRLELRGESAPPALSAAPPAPSQAALGPQSDPLILAVIERPGDATWAYLWQTLWLLLALLPQGALSALFGFMFTPKERQEVSA
jgi:hypothetical protein